MGTALPSKWMLRTSADDDDALCVVAGLVESCGAAAAQPRRSSAHVAQRIGRRAGIGIMSSRPDEVRRQPAAANEMSALGAAARGAAQVVAAARAKSAGLAALLGAI